MRRIKKLWTTEIALECTTAKRREIEENGYDIVRELEDGTRVIRSRVDPSYSWVYYRALLAEEKAAAEGV